jgi:thiamine-phosphate pyrophosphorylase
VLSVALPSRSASAGPALGPVRLAIRARAAGRPAYALGGIDDRTAGRLLDTGVIGLAAVEGLAGDVAEATAEDGGSCV